MMPIDPPIMTVEEKDLEAFNVKLCRDSGAGRGAETSQISLREYARLMRERADECRSLIAACRQTNKHSHFVDGMESALIRQCA